MNNLIWLIRAAKWSRRPPSAKMVKLVFAIIGAGLLLLALERFGLWPEWAMMDRRPPRLPH
ncbi:hypothetical protein D3P06_04820 [Paracoccus aestuarii]|uniref:Uncharacterized protein n=1 Tax=Paracoccus aestuarii TaxID=453842 RepID=A0A418ZZR8_9RHOB|nr:hypothetical protein [Paracoccus aestuarii]RJL06106.1 hypothetical protein D3P06_04820 [Paracoccus aestuarii]WCQ98057.1 hypothetical protein JHW48_08735 [Paracoccus aestuarii]